MLFYCTFTRLSLLGFGTDRARVLYSTGVTNAIGLEFSKLCPEGWGVGRRETFDIKRC